MITNGYEIVCCGCLHSNSFLLKIWMFNLYTYGGNMEICIKYAKWWPLRLLGEYFRCKAAVQLGQGNEFFRHINSRLDFKWVFLKKKHWSLGYVVLLFIPLHHAPCGLQAVWGMITLAKKESEGQWGAHLKALAVARPCGESTSYCLI